MNKLLQLAKTNLAMLLNAGSLVGTTAVTSLLGFAYWWLAARLFSPNSVGLATAMISAMTLLGTLSMLGLGTLLTGELPRQPGKEWALINAALIVSGGAGIIVGVAFALVSPFISPNLQTIGASIPNIAFFALGVSLTAITLVLDQALIGILRGGLQLWRNTLFSAIKLAALFAASFLLFQGQVAGMLIYVTWLVGNILSLVVLIGQKSKTPARDKLPEVPVSGPGTGVERSIKLPCPDCGALSPNSVSFCMNCGYPFSPTVEIATVRPQLQFSYGVIGLSETSVIGRRKPVSGSLCPDCGSPTPGNAFFCAHCGYPLTPTVELASVNFAKPPVAIEAEETRPLVTIEAENARAAVSAEDTLLFPPATREAQLPAKIKNTPLPISLEDARMAIAAEDTLLFPAMIKNTPPPAEIKETPLPVAVDTPQSTQKEDAGSFLPQWALLRKLGGAAIQHHILNVILLAPPQVLPILVTIELSQEANAWFYFSFMLANFVFNLTYALSTVLYAVSSAQPSLLAQKTRFTLGLSFLTSLGANLVLQVGAGLLLSLFGHAYADQAAWCLRILSLAVFPLIIKSHYIAICRVQDRITYVILPIAIGTLIEIGLAAVGAHLSGLLGLSSGWLAALVLEAIYMSYTVYKAANPVNVNTMPSKKTAKAL